MSHLPADFHRRLERGTALPSAPACHSTRPDAAPPRRPDDYCADSQCRAIGRCRYAAPAADINEAQLARLTERGAVAWAGVDAQALREGGVSAPTWPCHCDERGIGTPGVTCGDCPRDYGHTPASAPSGEPAAFRVSVQPLVASNGTTHIVCIDHPSRPLDAAPWDAGRMTPSQHDDPQHAEIEAQTWREFFANSGRKLTDIVADVEAGAPLMFNGLTEAETSATASVAGPAPQAAPAPQAEPVAMTADQACNFVVWWTHKRAAFTTPRQAAWAAWTEARTTQPAPAPQAAFADPEVMPWLLSLETAQRIGNEHRVRVGTVQAIAKAVQALHDAQPAPAQAAPTVQPVAEKLDAEAEGKRRCYESTGDPQYLHEYGAYRHAARIVREQAAPAPTDLALALAAAQQSYCHPNEPEAGWCLIDRRHVETLCKAAQAAPATATTSAAEADSASGEVRHG